MATAYKATLNSRFQRGSGVYTCRVCEHRTRATGGDGAGVGLCDTCYELAGEQNHLSDYGKTYGTALGVRSMLDELDRRSGEGTARRCFPEVWAAAYPADKPEPQAEPTPEARPEPEAKPEPIVIDCTPTWAGVLPILLAAVESGTDEGRAIAKRELARMAEAADRFNASTKS